MSSPNAPTVKRARPTTKELRDQADQLLTQLAGCTTAALRLTADPATRGDYGWSVSYQDVLNLRRKFDRYEKALREIARVPARAAGVIQADEIARRALSGDKGAL